MRDYSGTPLDANQAWTMLDRWKIRGQEIGLIFWGRSANLYTFGVLKTARDGRIQFHSSTARASFKLAGAAFKYGPMQTWPRWPNPPIVEVIALQAYTATGTWIIMAEGVRPDALSTQLLSR